MKKILIWSITQYQKYLSPDHSIWAKHTHRLPYCKYTPTCSEYAKESIEKKGAIIGSGKALWRILRCNPWSKGGYDPVEEKEER